MHPEPSAPLDPVEMERILSEASHALRNTVQSVRTEAELGLLRFERTGDAAAMRDALEQVVRRSEDLIRIVNQKLERCRRRDLLRR